MIDFEELKTRFIESYHRLCEQFSRGQVIAISLLVGLLILGSGILYLKSRPMPVKIEPPKLIKTKTNSKSSKLVAHVAGAVNKPGVYELEKGSRIIQAVKEAGGPTQDADLDALNLAAKIGDGQKVYLPRKGEVPTSNQSAPGGSNAGGSAVNPDVLSDGSSVLTNLNTGTQEQFEELPGIGPVLAKRLIEHRTKKFFRQVDDLQEVEGIGPKKFSQLKDKVTVN